MSGPAPAPAHADREGPTGTVRRTAVAWLGLFLAAAGLPGPGHAAPAVAYTAWQEIVILTVVKVRHAASHCGFVGDAGRIDGLLASAALSRADLDMTAASASLARQAAADADAYAGNADLACTEAWDRFGPNGAPGIRDLLGR